MAIDVTLPDGSSRSLDEGASAWALLQRLAEGVVQLVRAGVKEVLTL